MSDSLTDIQGLLQARIVAATDLTALTVVIESDGNAEATVDAAIDSDGIAAIVLFPDLEPGGSTNQYRAAFTVGIKELVSGRSFAKDSAEVAIQIFNQLRNWTPSATWQRIGALKIETVELEPYIIRTVSGHSGIHLS
jgi:threonine synthase